MCWTATPAYTIALMSTFHVGLWPWWPSLHLLSPSCTAASSFKGLFTKHASTVSGASPSPSSTALPFPAAFLLTYFRKTTAYPSYTARRQRTSGSTWLACVCHAMSQLVPNAQNTHSIQSERGRCQSVPREPHQHSDLVGNDRKWSCQWRTQAVELRTYIQLPISQMLDITVRRLCLYLFMNDCNILYVTCG